MPDPRDRYPDYPSVPVGDRIMYPDNQGGLHPTPHGAISENQRTERDFSRGTSGGCGQDPSNVPDRVPDKGKK